MLDPVLELDQRHCGIFGAPSARTWGMQSDEISQCQTLEQMSKGRYRFECLDCKVVLDSHAAVLDHGKVKVNCRIRRLLKFTPFNCAA